MALKYQAVNGTVVSNTTIIEGTDMAHAGTVRLALGNGGYSQYGSPKNCYYALQSLATKTSATAAGRALTTSPTTAYNVQKQKVTLDDGTVVSGFSGINCLVFKILAISSYNYEYTQAGTFKIVTFNFTTKTFNTYSVTGNVPGTSSSAASLYLEVYVPYNSSEGIMSVSVENSKYD